MLKSHSSKIIVALTKNLNISLKIPESPKPRLSYYTVYSSLSPAMT